MKLCKYAKVISLKSPIECKYKSFPWLSCPKDSGTDGACNNKCYEYSIEPTIKKGFKEGEEG